MPVNGKKSYIILLLIVISNINNSLSNKICSNLVKESLNENELIDKLNNRIHELKNQTNQ